MVLDVDQIRARYRFEPGLTRRGNDVVAAGLSSKWARSCELAEERDLLHIATTVHFSGDTPVTLAHSQFLLEDSEGFLIEGIEATDALSLSLSRGQSGAGGLMFALYQDVQPMRLWFDTGLRYDDDRRDPLLLEVPLPDRPVTERVPSWQEEAAMAFDSMLEEERSSSTVLPLFQTEELMASISGRLGVPYKKLPNGYMFQLPLAGGRRQIVMMTFSGKDEDGADLIKFVTVCAPLAPNIDLAQFLELNPRMSYGAVGVAALSGGREFLVVTTTQLVATADHEELLKSIRCLAQRGDELEARLTGGADLR